MEPTALTAAAVAIPVAEALDEEEDVGDEDEVEAEAGCCCGAVLPLFGLVGCMIGVKELTAGGVLGWAAVDGMDEVRDTAGRAGGRGIVDENDSELLVLLLLLLLLLPRPPLLPLLAALLLVLLLLLLLGCLPLAAGTTGTRLTGVAGWERVFLWRPTEAEGGVTLLPLPGGE